MSASRSASRPRSRPAPLTRSAVATALALLLALPPAIPLSASPAASASAAASTSSVAQGDRAARKAAKKVRSADDLVIVNCLLPPKIRRLGRNKTYATPRRPVRTTAVECRVRGGEYTEPDQANLGTALKVWLPQAQGGDAEAQYYLGQMFERGLGVAPDYAAAAQWYRKAAEQGDSAAQISLGSLYEAGRGVPRDEEEAIRWFRRAAGMAEDLVVLQGGEYQELVEAEERLAEVEAELSEARREIDRLQGELEALDAAQDREREALAARRAELEGQLAAARDRVSGLEERLRRGAEAPTPTPTQPSQDRVAETDTRVEETDRFDLDRLAFGRYHALVIGNSRYQHLPAVGTAERDARAVADVLRQRYGFEVELILDATRFDIMRALNELRQNLTSEDNLLVYYAGHAHRAGDDRTAYWQPVDAEPSNPANWIASEMVSEHLDLVPARHVLLVADALFSGLRSRSAVARLPAGMTAEERYHHVRLLRDKRCRLVLASGRPAPRPRTPDEPHSGFASAFVRVLSENDGLLEASRVYRSLTGELSGNTPDARPPEFAAMQWARNDISEFFFVPRS